MQEATHKKGERGLLLEEAGSNWKGRGMMEIFANGNHDAGGTHRLCWTACFYLSLLELAPSPKVYNPL